MTTMPAVRTSQDLYPAPTSLDLSNFMYWIALAGRDAKHNAVLRRELTITERDALLKRGRALAATLERAPIRKIAKLISETLSGFGSSRASAEEAEIVAAQYAVVLAGLPLWAIERACLRFAGGDVKPEEIGAKHIDPNFGPSSAAVKIVASKIAAPYEEDLVKVRMICGGTVAPKEIGPEERKRVGEKLAARAKEMKQAGEVVDLEAQRVALARAAEVTKQTLLGEYRSAGLEPVCANDGTTLISLSMLRSLGYTVEEVAGERTLIAPAREAAS